MYLAALTFTVIGWGFQIYETLVRKTRNINIFLPLFYAIGTVLFGISDLSNGDTLGAILDWVTTVLALIVLIFLLIRKKA